MKKLALILAVVFTMSLTASTVSAATQDKAPKKTEAPAKKEDCAKAKECPASAKKSCCGDKKAK